MLNVIIVDDEKHVADSIELLLKEYCKDVNILGKCTSYQEGIDCISQKRPDLLLLDIEMPFGTGFDLLERFTEINFDVVFITAYSQYAIKAIKYSALDYILKPVDINELKAAIKKVIERKNNNRSKINYDVLFENLKSQMPTKLAVPTSDGMEYVSISDIVRISADGRYSTIYLISKKSFFVSKNLGEFEELLTSYQFFRVHNSTLINLNYVRKYSRTDGGIIEMVDSSQLPISRSKKNDFLIRMKEISK